MDIINQVDSRKGLYTINYIESQKVHIPYKTMVEIKQNTDWHI